MGPAVGVGPGEGNNVGDVELLGFEGVDGAGGVGKRRREVACFVEA